MLGFAVLYVVLFLLNDLMAGWLTVIDGRISLLFLPAFARVAAVVVAKLAGLLGLFLGSLIMGLVHGDPLWVALGVSCASVTGIFFAYWILLHAMRLQALPVSLPILLVLTALYAPLNAMMHAFVWEALGVSAGITAQEIGLMMAGDMFGVLVLFLMLRAVFAIVKTFKRPGPA